MTLNVGEGFVYPDATEQVTAGVVPDNSTGFYYALSAPAGQDGKSPEKATQTIQGAIDAAAVLGSLATVNEAEGGVYIENITLYDQILFEGTQTALVTTGLVGILAASEQSFRPQAIISNTQDATLLHVNGVSQFGAEVRSLEIGGQDTTGIEVTGMNSGNFFTVSSAVASGEGATIVDYAGQSTLQSDFNFNTVRLEADDSTFFRFRPMNPLEVTDINISGLSNADAMAQQGTNTTGILAEAGIVKVRAGSLVADTVVETFAGATVSVSANVLAGTTTCAGAVIYDTIGVIIGDIDVAATGDVLWRGSSITGNLVNAGNASIVCTVFDGEITNTGSMYVQIGSYTGTLPTDDGSINGIINGVRYGNWKTLGYVLATWGGDLQNTGRYPTINGASNTTQVSGLGVNVSAPVHASGTIDTITYYNTSGDNTTQFEIVKNGAVMHTFTCTGFYGVETGINVPVGFVGGLPDNIAIRYSAGTKPAAGFYSMYIN